jgi:hypothetical protein
MMHRNLAEICFQGFNRHPIGRFTNPLYCGEIPAAISEDHRKLMSMVVVRVAIMRNVLLFDTVAISGSGYVIDAHGMNMLD